MGNINTTGTVWLTNSNEETIAAKAVVVMNEDGTFNEGMSIDSSSDSPIYTSNSFKQFSAEAQLTEPGTTSSLDVSSYPRITCQFTVANFTSNVVVRLEGSCDGVNWWNLDPSDNDYTVTANGTYAFIINDVALLNVRFRFVSELSSTSATIDVRMVAN